MTKQSPSSQSGDGLAPLGELTAEPFPMGERKRQVAQISPQEGDGEEWYGNDR